MDFVGHAKLRQRPAYANHGHRPWRVTSAVQECEGWNGVQGELVNRSWQIAIGNWLGVLMLDQSQAQKIFDKIKRYSSVAEIETIFSSTDFSLTRFANNTIHQNVSELNEAASIRVAFDGKTARASTNRFDDEGLKRAVQSAEGIARVQEPDPDFLPMATASEGKGPEGPSRWSDQTAAITPADRA